MASTTVDSPSDRSLQLDSIPVVDLRLLSQSELYSLSLCSDSAFDLRGCDDVIIPKIDRSVFNESAGSRKQTYPRLRLAPAASAASTIHRRTPHIRNHVSPPLLSSTVNDPEQVENSQIIHFLKEFFKSDGNPNDLVPVEVDLGDLAPDLTVEYPGSVPDSSNHVNVGRKRKRGRPRKDEKRMIPGAAALKGVKRIRDKIFKKNDAYNNVEDMDRGIVNSKGFSVNVAVLEGLEDPYGHEIRRRTEGLVTEDELLGFLKGLNGLWASRRKKKRIVDASDFGDALPKNWKISLSIKRKEGRIWLFCRRYISPSGRQFESCKEVSAYLLSIIGNQNDESPYTRSNIDDKVAFKVFSEDAPDALQEEKTDAVLYNESRVTSLSTNLVEQVTMKIGGPTRVEAEESFKCLDSTITFDRQDNLLEHQLLSDGSKKPEASTSINDGANVTEEVKNTESLCAATIGQDVPSVLLGGVPDRDALVQASVVEGNNVVLEIYDGHCADELRSGSHGRIHQVCCITETSLDEMIHGPNVLAHEKQDLQVIGEGSGAQESNDKRGGKCIGDGDELRGIDQTPDIVAAKSDYSVGYETSLPVNENNRNLEKSGEMHAIECVDHKMEDLFLDQERTCGSCMLSPVPIDQTSSDVVKDVVDISDSFKVITSDTYNITGGTSNLDELHINGMANESMCEKEKFINSKSKPVFCNDCDWLAEDEVKRPSSEEDSVVLSRSNAVDVAGEANALISSTKASQQKRCTAGSLSVDENTLGINRNLNKVSTSLICPTFDGKYVAGSNDYGSYAGPGVEAMTNLEEENHFKNCSSVSSWMEKNCVNENNGNNVSICNAMEPTMEMNSESSAHLSCEQNCLVEKNVEKVSAKKSVEATLNEFQSFRNNEQIMTLDCQRGGLNTGVMTINTETNLEFFSLVPSENDHAFHLQDDVTDLYDSAMEECKQESSERGLLNQFCIGEASEDLFVNKMYSTPLDGLKFDEDRAIGNHDLSLTFGNPPAELYADAISVEHKKDLVNCSIGPSKIEHTYDVQTNLSMVNSSMVDNDKEGRDSMNDFFSLSRNSETSGFGNNVNTVYHGRAWEGLKADDYRNSENKKFMADFCSSTVRSDEDVGYNDIWKPAGSNAARSGLVDPSHTQVQSSNYFQVFGVMPDKAEDGFFRPSQKYNHGSGVSLRSDRSEPVEFSFMSTHDSGSFQGDPKVFSYGAEMEQEFDSSFWLGKNALMPNIAGRGQFTAICVWCRNEFHLPHIQSGSQAGLGSMCPTCTARLSEQVNIL